MNGSSPIDINFYNRLVEATTDNASDLSTRFFASMCLVFYWFIQALITLMFIFQDILTHIYTHFKGIKAAAPTHRE